MYCKKRLYFKFIFSINLISILLQSVCNLFGSKEFIEYKDDPLIDSISKYVIYVPSEVETSIHIKEVGVGSSLTYKGQNERGDYIFYGIGDRGPLALLPKDCSGEHSLLLPYPHYIPSIFELTLDKQKGTVTSVIRPKYEDHYVNAKSLPQGNGAFYQKFINRNKDLKILKNDLYGVDLEGIDIDSEGNYWAADEMWPSIIKIKPNATKTPINDGLITEVYRSGTALPEILRYVQENRGFEGIAVVKENSKIYCPLESVLNIKKETLHTASLIRIIEFDSKSKAVRTFAYKLNKNEFKNLNEVKISDITAIPGKKNEFLIIEQGIDHNNVFKRNIAKIDITHAEDITNKHLTNGKELEYGTPEDLKDIQFVKKEILFDLGNYSWDLKKLEGITILDPYTLAISNDNDFSFSDSYSGGNYQREFFDEYLIHTKGCYIYHFDKILTKESLPGGNKNEPNFLWIIKLKKPLY